MKISELTVAPESTTIVSAAAFGIGKQNITAALAGVPTKKPRRVVKYKERARHLEISLERSERDRDELTAINRALECKLDARTDELFASRTHAKGWRTLAIIASLAAIARVTFGWVQ